MIPRASGALGLCLFLGAAGCVSQPEWPAPETQAAGALGIQEALQLGIDAPPPPPQGVVTLDQAIVSALRHNPRIDIALAEVREAQAEAWQDRLLPNPVVSVALRFPEGGGQPTVEAGLGAELLSLLRRPARVRAADARLRAASAEAVVAVLDVVAEVQERYAEAQALQSATPLLQRRRDALVRLNDLERSRFEGGEVGRLDLVTLDAERVLIEAEVDDLRLELRRSQLALARLMGVPNAPTDWRVADAAPPAYSSVAEDRWVAAALRNRPEIQQRIYELEALGIEESRTRLWLLGEVEVGVDAEHAESAWEAGPALSAPIPVFDWGQANRAVAQAQRLQAAHGLEATKQDVIAEVRQAAAAFNESVHRLRRVRDELVPLQEQRHELAEQAFRAGEGDATTLLLADQDLAEAQQRLVELQRRTAVALAELHRAVGGGGHAASLVAADPSAASRETRSIGDDTREVPVLIEEPQPRGEQP